MRTTRGRRKKKTSSCKKLDEEEPPVPRPTGRPRTALDGAVRLQRTIRLSDAEWDWVRAQAILEGLTTSEWIRETLGVPS